MSLKKIFKYPVKLMDHFLVEMPHGARPLCVQMQGGEPMMWCLVNPDAEMELREFRVRGTGHDIEETANRPWEYVGSWQSSSGAFVWHLFDMGHE